MQLKITPNLFESCSFTWAQRKSGLESLVLPKRNLKLDILIAQISVWWAKTGWIYDQKCSSQLYFTKKQLFRFSRKFPPIFIEICIFRILATQILFFLALGRLHPLSCPIVFENFNLLSHKISIYCPIVLKFQFTVP